MARETDPRRKLEPVSPTGAAFSTPCGYAATLLHGGPVQILNASSDFVFEDILRKVTSRRFRRAAHRPSDATGSDASRADSFEDPSTSSSNSSKTGTATDTRKTALESPERPPARHVVIPVRAPLDDRLRVLQSSVIRFRLRRRHLRRFPAPTRVKTRRRRDVRPTHATIPPLRSRLRIRTQESGLWRHYPVHHQVTRVTV